MFALGAEEQHQIRPLFGQRPGQGLLAPGGGQGQIGRAAEHPPLGRAHLGGIAAEHQLRRAGKNGQLLAQGLDPAAAGLRRQAQGFGQFRGQKVQHPKKLHRLVLSACKTELCPKGDGGTDPQNNTDILYQNGGLFAIKRGRGGQTAPQKQASALQENPAGALAENLRMSGMHACQIQQRGQGQQQQQRREIERITGFGFPKAQKEAQPRHAEPGESEGARGGILYSR